MAGDWAMSSGLKTGKDGIQDIELEPKTTALVKLGEHYNLWKGEAKQQLTLVDLAKGLKERYAVLRQQKIDAGYVTAEDLPELP